MPNAIQFEVHHPAVATRAHRPAATRRAPRRLSRILVATDGTAASEGAVVVAGLLARRHRATVDVVSVLTRWGESPPGHEFLDITGELLDERLASVIPQGRRALGSGKPFWTIRMIDSSSIVDSIAETARTDGHDLIVMGNRRGWITRWFRRPNALAVAQRSGVPVLVVPEPVSALPTRAVVGVEGTDVDLTTAATAAGLLAEGAALHLVRVDTSEAPVTRESDSLASSVEWGERFAELERSIADAGIADVNRVVLRGGEPAERLVSYAEGINAQLIVAGTRRQGTIAERVFGGAGGRILRAADRSVLLYAN